MEDNMQKVGEKVKKIFNKETIVGKILQVVIGLLIVGLIYWLAVWIIKTDVVTAKNPFDTNIKKQVSIIDGYADSSQVAGNVYNTVIPFATNSLSLIPSSNIKGGAQFTYMLWLNIGTNDNSQSEKTIFIRGDANKYKYNTFDNMTKIPLENTDYVAFCPMLQFGLNNMDFRVRFNTANKINQELYVKTITDDNDMYRRNLLSLFAKKWFMVTIVFEDNIPINDFENGLSVKFYINEQMYASATYSDMLKQNVGDLYLFPDNSPLNKVMISNMFYFNYALGPKDITSFYMQGPSPKSVSSVATSFIMPMILNDKNRLDIYNA